MENVKETVYERVHQEIYTNEKYRTGIDTKAISDLLSLQRSNVSTVLNNLVKEGRLNKTRTRPVLYTISTDEFKIDQSCFIKLIGYDGSLRNSVQLAKAAILYPLSNLNVLLTSKTGCGTTYFANLMLDFAKENGKLSKDAPSLKIDVRHYSQNVSILNEELFGANGDLNNSCFVRAQGGMLFIDNIDLLDAKQQSFLFEFLDSGKIYSEDKSRFIVCDNVILLLSCSPSNHMQFNRIIPVNIELAELRERPLTERLRLIYSFFQSEAIKSERPIEVTGESIKALLLSEFPYNIKGLKMEIQTACANAFVRVVNDKGQTIAVCLEDFKKQVSSSLLKLKGVDNTFDGLLENRESFLFTNNDQIERTGLSKSNLSLYSEIQKQYDELTNLGINEGGVEEVINSHIQNLFKEYRTSHNWGNNTNDLEKLSKIVGLKVIDLVTQFLNKCQHDLRHNYPPKVFYGLCLHVNSLLTSKFGQKRLDNDLIIKIIQDYSKEYAECVQFANEIKNVLNLDLSIQEVVLITLFLVEPDESEESEHPVVLYIMHGEGTARSLKEVTNSLTQCDNAYSYDMGLNIETNQAMEEIKNLIESIDRGKGIIVIYDMGSIKTMLDLISEKSSIKIRYFNIPITLAGIDIARKCSMETDIDYIYHQATVELNSFNKKEEKLNNIIITLCHTGEGGALELKNYIDQNSNLGIKTIALSMSSKNELLKEVMTLRKIYKIHSFVGTFDPKLLGIPFIPINKIFENSRDHLDRILMFEPDQSKFIDYSSIYEYLNSQFKYASISKLKMVLPSIIDKLDSFYNFSEEQNIGLFMHLACLVERLLEGKRIKNNPDKAKILSIFDEDYPLIVETLKELEKTFKIIIDNNEVATILLIIKQL